MNNRITKWTAAAMMMAAVICSCDDTTDMVGGSLTDNNDIFQQTSLVFDNVKSRSIQVDSVLSSGRYSYLGHIKDPETNTYVTSHYTAQFSIQPTLTGETMFPAKDSIRSLENGLVMADSCKMFIHIYSSMGDTLNPMKLSVQEMAKPVEEGRQYYSNYNPENETGMLRNDGNQIFKTKMYTPVDLNLTDSLRGLIYNGQNVMSLKLDLNDEYTDMKGNKFNNYGTYIMRNYYDNPKNFDNTYNFVHNVNPGFYVKSVGGSGSMSMVYLTELCVYFRYESYDSIYKGSLIISSTEEAMQTSQIINDKKSIAKLLENANDTCTFLKTPSGLFTEVELPVEDIINGGNNGVLSSAKIEFTRLNPSDENTKIPAPSYLLMVPKDSLFSDGTYKTFFEKKNLPDYKFSYLASLNKSTNKYSFNNISNLINNMYENKQKGKASTDWNKVILVPVTVTYSASSSTTITNITNTMTLSSARLVGGSNNHHEPLSISVVYTKREE